MMHRGRIRDNEHELKEETFGWDIRKSGVLVFLCVFVLFVFVWCVCDFCFLLFFIFFF